MKYYLAQKLFCVIFLAVLFGFSIANFYTQRPAIFKGILEYKLPATVSETKKYIANIENAVNTNILGKTEFIDGYAYVQLLMGKYEIDNFNAIRGLDGHMNYANFYPVETDYLKEYAKRMKRMQDYVGEDCKVLFLSPPAMYIRGESEYAPGIPYYDLNPRQDALLYFLQSYGIDYIDSRVTFAQKDLPPENYIFNTDHHWTIEACFESFIDIIDTFRDIYGIDLDPDGFYIDLNNYNSITYPESFLGSLGKRSGAIFSGLDDFTLIWPKFDSDYKWEAIGSSGSSSKFGSYEEALLYPSALRTDDPYNIIIYSVYMSGIKTWTKITNNQNQNGAKLLMIHDSYSVPLATFLAPLFSEIHMIWPLADSKRIDIDDYIEKNTFDYIIIELYPGNFNDEGMNFFTQPLEDKE